MPASFIIKSREIRDQLIISCISMYSNEIYRISCTVFQRNFHVLKYTIHRTRHARFSCIVYKTPICNDFIAYITVYIFTNYTVYIVCVTIVRIKLFYRTSCNYNYKLILSHIFFEIFYDFTSAFQAG